MSKPPLEAFAWREAFANVDALDPPPALAEAIATLDRVTVARDALVVEHRDAPDGGVDAGARAALTGASLTEAADQATAAATHRERLDHARVIGSAAVTVAERRVREWIESHRDELVTGPLRTAVASLVDQAAADADKLAPYAPTFDPSEIANNANKAELEAHRHIEGQAAAFDALVGAWLSTWRAATSTAAASNGWPGYLRVDRPGGLHAWECPIDVADVDVRDGIDTRLVAAAWWAEAGGFRLASGAEMVALTEAQRVESPHVPGEQQRRPVLLPTEGAMA